MVMCIISASLAAVMFLLSVLGALVGVPRKVSYRCVCLHSMLAECLSCWVFSQVHYCFVNLFCRKVSIDVKVVFFFCIVCFAFVFTITSEVIKLSRNAEMGLVVNGYMSLHLTSCSGSVGLKVWGRTPFGLQSSYCWRVEARCSLWSL